MNDKRLLSFCFLSSGEWMPNGICSFASADIPSRHRGFRLVKLVPWMDQDDGELKAVRGGGLDSEVGFLRLEDAKGGVLTHKPMEDLGFRLLRRSR